MNTKLISFIRSLTSHLLVVFLILSTSLAGSPSVRAATKSAQSTSQDRQERSQREVSQRKDDSNRSANEEPQEHGFVTYADGERSACRDMTNDEVRRIRRDPEQMRQLRVITQREREAVLGQRQVEATAEATSLKITLRSTQQLDGYPEAKAAFIRAAAVWEAQIKNPITIIVDVDFGPTRFGQPYPSGVLGSTGTPSYRVSYDSVRTRLVSSASSSAETSLYNALPTGSVMTEFGPMSDASVASPLMRALGLLPADAASSDPAPSIGFNSNFSFDFDPSDGISPGKTDFDAVAVHEMGHALGFISNVGLFEISPLATRALTVWDIFRFRPGTTMATFTSALRVLLSGGEQRYFDGNPELATSTGKPDGSGGDGRQASHWKADELSGLYIGIMDPTLASGVRKTMTSNDLQMLETIGYQISGTPPPPPCTFNLSASGASFDAAGGNGTVGVSASASTCPWTATRNDSWISISSGASGTGNGTVGYSVAANPSTSSRSGSLTVAGLTFSVTQAGQTGSCSYSVGNFSTTYPASGGAVVIPVTTASGCQWSATENVSWLTFYPSTTTTGSGNVILIVGYNSSGGSRSATVTIAGKTYSITQN